MKDAVLAEYVRDGFVESVHRGYLLALNADGSTALELGDSSTLIFPRSCVKSIQGAAMVRAGLKLEPRLLALGCSSHSGSEEHLIAVREILAMAKLDESALQCMLDKPLGDAERRAWGDKPATRISMNCSGKHAAMLLTCVLNGWPTDSYLDPVHPLQVAIKSELERLRGHLLMGAVHRCSCYRLLVWRRRFEISLFPKIEFIKRSWKHLEHSLKWLQVKGA
jgi:L-asparaginase II